jgi:hypothetical protein
MISRRTEFAPDSAFQLLNVDTSSALAKSEHACFALGLSDHFWAAK